jgi:CheY-like chemotaxis protein
MADLKRILLVEDSKKDVELTLAALDHHHLANEVVVARDGVEALDFLCRRGKFKSRAEEFPAVVLLDLKLPKVDGLEVLRAMKGDPHLRQIPVVMLTSSREEQDLRVGGQRVCGQAGGISAIREHGQGIGFVLGGD